MNTKKSFFFILLIVIAVVAISVGVYFLQDKSNTDQIVIEKNENWKTYSNTQYGFEFKYPKNWVIEEEMTAPYYGQPENKAKDLRVDLKSPERIELSKNTTNPYYKVGGVVIKTYSDHPALKAKSLGDWLTTSQVEWNPGISKQELIPIQKTMVDEKDAYIYQQQIGDGRPVPVTVFIKNGDVILTVDFAVDEEIVKNNMDAMLSGFKFIKL